MLAETFGINGTAQAFFGGQWWLVGLFLLFIFAIVLYNFGVGGEMISIFIVTGLLVTMSYQLFSVASGQMAQIVQTILFFIFIVVGYFVYRFFSK